MRKRALLGYGCAALFVITTAACSGTDDKGRGNGDAPVDRAHVDNTPAKVFDFSNNYPNIERKVDLAYCQVIYTNQRDPGYFQIATIPGCKPVSGVQPG